MNPAPAQLFAGVRLFAASWTAAPQAPLSLGFSRQEHWSGLPCASPGDLTNPGIKPGLPLCKIILYQLSHQGSPRLEWVAYPSSKGSPHPEVKRGSPALLGDSLPAEKRKKTLPKEERHSLLQVCLQRNNSSFMKIHSNIVPQKEYEDSPKTKLKITE